MEPRSQPAVTEVAVTDATESDVFLMERIGAGDHRAMRLLVERYQNPVVGTVARMLGDRTEAEDIAQQVFLRIWKHAARYRPEAKFTTYLFTITRNLVFNESRRRSRRKDVSVEERAESGQVIEEAHAGSRPDEQLIMDELVAEVNQAISQLPEAQRTAVILRRYEQLPYEDIADVLGISVSAVKSLLFRARTTLRERLRSHLED